MSGPIRLFVGTYPEFPPLRNRWFGSLAAGENRIRTCSTAARKSPISKASRHFCGADRRRNTVRISASTPRRPIRRRKWPA